MKTITFFSFVLNRKQTFFMTLLFVAVLVPQTLWAVGPYYWGGTSADAYDAAKWSLTDGGPYTEVFVDKIDAVFNIPTSTIGGPSATLKNFASITANENVTFTPNSILLGTSNSVIPITVATGKVFDFSTQNFTTTGTGFIKEGEGELRIKGNGYLGGFTLNAGIFTISYLQSAGKGEFTINGGILTATGTGTRNMQGSNIVIGGNFNYGANTYAADGTTLVGNAAMSSLYPNTIPVSLGTGAARKISFGGSGKLILNGVISGSGSSIEIDGNPSGGLTLGGANTYDGGTTITNGTLLLAASEVLANAGTVTLNGGILKTTTTFSETMGTLALTNNSTIALQTGVNTLNFANSQAIAWTSGKTLTITGWEGSAGASGTAGKIIVGSDATGLTTTQLAQINFTGFNAGAMILSTGEVVPTTSISINANTNASLLSDCATCNVSVSAGNTLTIDSNKTFDNVTVAAGGKLTINDGISLTSTVTLESTADATTASIVDNYSTPTIDATINQYVTAGRNWYMSVPLNNTAAYSVLNRGSSVAEYDETTGLFQTVSSGNLTRGKGYIQVASSTQGTTGNVSFTGTTNSGDVSISLTYTSDSGKGYNLVGNPYPSFLSWSAVAADNIAANMPTGSMWYRTVNYNGKSAWHANTAYSIDDIVYNANRFYKATQSGLSAASGGPTGNGTSILDNAVVWNYEGSVYMFATISASGLATPATVSNLVPPMQAFWVKSNGGTLTFKNSMRTHNTGGTNAIKAPKNLSNNLQLLRLNATNGISADETVIYATENASNSIDTYDAPKYFNTGSNQPEVFTQVGNEKLAINAMNEIKAGSEIALGFVTEKGNDFTISVTEWKNPNPDMQVVLKDKHLNREFDLTNGHPYVFSSTSVNSSERFSLIFKLKGVETSIENSEISDSQVFVNTANQLVIVAPFKSIYRIYNTLGQLMETEHTTGKMQTVTSKLQTGVYVVYISKNGQYEKQKVIIR